MEESFDSNLDSDFRAALRKLYKKDMLTKLKVTQNQTHIYFKNVFKDIKIHRHLMK